MAALPIYFQPCVPGIEWVLALSFMTSCNGTGAGLQGYGSSENCSLLTAQKPILISSFCLSGDINRVQLSFFPHVVRFSSGSSFYIFQKFLKI